MIWLVMGHPGVAGHIAEVVVGAPVPAVLSSDLDDVQVAGWMVA
jgi:hypothetical protein